jgi:hypothetical protein
VSGTGKVRFKIGPAHPVDPASSRLRNARKDAAGEAPVRGDLPVKVRAIVTPSRVSTSGQQPR